MLKDTSPFQTPRHRAARPKSALHCRVIAAGVSIATGSIGAAQTVPPAAPSNESATECLERARDLVEQDKYDDAAPWYQAAQLRAADPRTRSWAQIGVDSLKLLGKPAPALTVMKWVGGRPAALPQFHGKVVMLYFWNIAAEQSRVAERGISELASAYRDRGLRVLGIGAAQRVPYGLTPEWAEDNIKERRFGFPVAIDADFTKTYRAYLSGDFPYIALIDREGRLRWLSYFERGPAEKTIRRLLDEGQVHQPRVTVPESREGRELIGEPAPPLVNKTWLNTKGGRPPELTGHPWLIRFWMDECRYCRATAPSLRQIQKDYADRGLIVIGAYHPKPAPKSVLPVYVKLAARELGLEFPIFLDNDWQYLRAIWLDSGEREYTSATFLIDRNGMIRFIHPGPDFFPSAKETERLQNDDYQALRRAIEAVLAENPTP